MGKSNNGQPGFFFLHSHTLTEKVKKPTFVNRRNPLERTLAISTNPTHNNNHHQLCVVIECRPKSDGEPWVQQQKNSYSYALPHRQNANNRADHEGNNKYQISMRKSTGVRLQAPPVALNLLHAPPPPLPAQLQQQPVQRSQIGFGPLERATWDRRIADDERTTGVGRGESFAPTVS